MRSTVRADLVIALGGDGTLLEPVVDRDMHRLFMGFLITRERVQFKVQRSKFNESDPNGGFRRREKLL